MKTQTIAGHEITLEAGVRFYASRPIAEFGRRVYPVSIRTLTGVDPVLVVPDLSIAQANALINEFNNGPTSFTGRVW